jgi:hypothetical protein
MALNAGNVLVAATGAAMIAPLGTTAPTDATSAWGAGWLDLGYLSEDGFTENPILESDEIKAWQSGAIVRKVITGSGEEFSFDTIETNLNTVTLFYPGSVITVAGSNTKVEIHIPVATPQAFGFDVIDGSRRARIIVPRAELTERGEVNYKNADAVAQPFTVNATPDSAGILAIKYFNPVLS